MNTYVRLKRLVYVAETLLGCFLLTLAFWLSRGDNAASVINNITSLIIMAAGLISVLFGITTYILRDEQDIWR